MDRLIIRTLVHIGSATATITEWIADEISRRLDRLEAKYAELELELLPEFAPDPHLLAEREERRRSAIEAGLAAGRGIVSRTNGRVDGVPVLQFDRTISPADAEEIRRRWQRAYAETPPRFSD